MTRRTIAVALAFVTALAGCQGGGGSDDGAPDARGSDITTTTAERSATSTSLAALPSDSDLDRFYADAAIGDAEPGDVLRAMEIDAPAGTRAWRIVYVSTTVKDDPVAVSAVLVAPESAPSGSARRPILGVAHGTTGLADECSPSRRVGADLDAAELADFPQRERFVVVATDYEGLGTPGVHPYVVGLSEGRNVLDAIRAAQRFPGIGTGTTSQSVVWGHSQGGGAALLAAELAPTYAADANLAGVAAGAPAAELKLLASALRTSPFFGYVLMAAAGFKAAYPELDLSAVLTPTGLAAVTTAATQCAEESVAALQGKPAGDYLHTDPGSVEPFASLLEENSPGVRSTTVPVFLYHGEADEQIPVVASKLVLDRYCRNGTKASRKTYPDANHVGVVPLAMTDITSFLDARLAGEPAPTSC